MNMKIKSHNPPLDGETMSHVTKFDCVQCGGSYVIGMVGKLDGFSVHIVHCPICRFDRSASELEWHLIATDWQKEVRDLLSSGKKVQAIRVWRHNTGQSLKETKEYLETMKEWIEYCKKA